MWTAVAGSALLVGLTGCAPSIQQQAEADLHMQLERVQKSFTSASSRVNSTTELLEIGYIPDFSEFKTNTDLNINKTGWYAESQHGHEGTVYVLGVGEAEGNEGLSYADAMVFRCVRMTVPLGRDGEVATEKVPCPPALRKAANIGGSGPEL